MSQRSQQTIFVSLAPNRTALVLYCSAIILVLAGSVQAQMPYEANTCRSTPSDTTFVPAAVVGSKDPNGGALCATGSFDGSCQSETTTFNITRVVGSGLTAQWNGLPQSLNPDGSLANPTALIASGIVSRYAYLQVDWANGSADSTTLHFTINGYSISGGDIAAETGSGGSKCLQVPIAYLRFGVRNPGSNALPTAGANQVQVSSTNPYPQEYDDTEITAYARSLSFEAMAPIIMVHGWGQKTGPWWWGDSPSSKTPYCKTDPQGSRKARDGGFNFVEPLVDGGYPFDCSLMINPPTALVPEGAPLLQNDLLQCHDGLVPDSNFVCQDGTQATGKLVEFGAKHAHLVAHSKGGLWAREMLYRMPVDANGNQLFGIYSLTTLETPHLGSSLADLVVAAHTVPLLWAVGVLGVPVLDFRILAAMKQDRAGADDLQVATATAYNTRWGHSPVTFVVDGIQNIASYYAIGSNADLNGNGKIDGASGTGSATTPPDDGYPALKLPAIIPTFVQNQIATLVQNQRFQWLGGIKNGNIHRLKVFGRTIISIADFDPTARFQSNDFTVTVASALGGFGFLLPIQPGTPCNGLPCRLANHTTAGSSMIWNQGAQQVLQLILQAQPLQ